MKISEYTLGFIGFGHFAKILFQSLDGAKLIPRSQMVFTQRDAHKKRENEERFRLTGASLETLVKKSDLLLLAVRPDQAEQVLRELGELGVAGKKVISVIAGIRFSFYQKFLGREVEILRTMPNLAAAAGEGMTALAYGENCSSEFRSLGHVLFKSMGETVELEEELLDTAVGVSGSGVGFVLRLLEAVARAGEKGGIAYEKAVVMAAQTFVGAAKLVLRGGKVQELVEQIVVPQGTTEAGFRVMKELEVEKRLQQVVEVAVRRSQELGNRPL